MLDKKIIQLVRETNFDIVLKEFKYVIENTLPYVYFSFVEDVKKNLPSDKEIKPACITDIFTVPISLDFVDTPNVINVKEQLQPKLIEFGRNVLFSAGDYIDGYLDNKEYIKNRDRAEVLVYKTFQPKVLSRETGEALLDGMWLMFEEQDDKEIRFEIGVKLYVIKQ